MPQASAKGCRLIPSLPDLTWPSRSAWTAICRFVRMQWKVIVSTSVDSLASCPGSPHRHIKPRMSFNKTLAQQRKRTPKLERPHTHVLAQGVIAEQTKRSLDCIEAARDGATRVHEVASIWGSSSTPQLAGRLAEEIHAATFNVDAAHSGMRTLHAATGMRSKMSTAAADIVVSRSGSPVARAQVKYHRTAARTRSAVSDTKYDGMQRIVPSDQVRDIQQGIGSQTISTETGSGSRPGYPVSDRLRLGSVSSAPITRGEALGAAESPELASSTLVSSQLERSVCKGAALGAALGGGVSAIGNLQAFNRGEKSGNEALVDTLQDALGSALSGASVSAIAELVQRGFVKVGAGSLAKSGASAAIGLSTVAMLRDLLDLLDRKIDLDDFALKTGHHSIRGLCVCLGMELGALIGTRIRPGPGTIVGGILGGAGGAWIATLLIEELQNEPATEAA